jgi:hypothetical protein
MTSLIREIAKKLSRTVDLTLSWRDHDISVVLPGELIDEIAITAKHPDMPVERYHRALVDIKDLVDTLGSEWTAKDLALLVSKRIESVLK